MVKLASTLPKEYDDNGLEANSRHLLGIYQSQKYLPIVALIHTKDVTHTEDFERVPRIEIVHVELAVEGELNDRARELLKELHDARISHVKQPLDFPSDEASASGDAPVEEPLALEAGEVVIDAELVDDDAPLALTGKDA